MRKLLLLACISFVFFAASAQNAVNKKFDSFKERFMSAYWEMYPNQATDAGYHAYDSVLIIPNPATRTRQKKFAQSFLDSLSTFVYLQLDDNNKMDYQLVENELKETIWSIDKAKTYEWSPSGYNVTGIFAYILNEPFDKLDTRLVNFNKKMRGIPAFYDAAKSNVRNPVPELTLLAIEQLTSGLSVFEKDLADSLAHSSLSEQQKTEIVENSKTAAKAIRSFTGWLGGFKDNADGRSFRLGSPLYEQKFAFNIQSSYTVQQLYDAAMERKDFLLQQMEQKAIALWPKYFGSAEKPAEKFALIKMVIDTISTQHVQAANFQSSIEEQLPKLTAFVKEKNLLYMDPSKPLKVRKEPGYMAGVAGASVSAPGPYEKNVSTYYNVGSLEGWTPARAESYLREYNNYTLQILNIHEGIPGHYVQLVYSNKAPSIIKSVFGNGSMVEGWAVYAEQMMMENGYNNSDEMWLMYYKWNLRTVCNTILDIGLHTKNMTQEEAMDLLVRKAFQQQAEAEGKWRRVSVSSVQLTSYFNGFYEILQLRNAYKIKLGASFSDKAFNEKFLSYGSSPVKYIRKVMLGE